MKAQIIKQNDNTYIFDEGTVRFFLLIGDECALLVDSGMNASDVKEMVDSLTDRPIKLINTHADRDHVANNFEFGELMLHPSEYTNYADHYTPGQKLIPVYDKDVIDLGNRPVKIIHLPGHTEGSIALLDINSKTLISGDPIQKDGKVFMFGPHRNLMADLESMKYLLSYKDQITSIWPSHSTMPLGFEAVEYCIKDIELLLENKLEKQDIEMHGNKIRLAKGNYTGFLVNE